MLLEQIATKLDVIPEQLERESLRVYVQRKLRLIESELFGLAQLFGIRNICEFDEKIRAGEFHEAEAFEEYFRFDYLESERSKLLEILETL